MSDVIPQRCSSAHPPTAPLAVFDLDGTLLLRDSLLPFLVSYCRRMRLRRRIPRVMVELALYALRVTSAATAKERLIRWILGGQALDEVAGHAEWFCREWIPRHTHPVGVHALRLHQRHGHRVILVSASPDLYVPAVARFFGIHEVICTRIAGEGNKVIGSILGKNCKGSVKVEMLTRHLGTDVSPAESYGYGDAKSDIPVLTWVRHGFWVRLRHGANGRTERVVP
jgi:phosphatidylglycerophosphatase C